MSKILDLEPGCPLIVTIQKLKNPLIWNCVYDNSKFYIFQYLHFRFSFRELGYASTHSCNYYFVQHFTIVTFIFYSTTLLLRHNFISRRCQASLMQVDGISTYLYLSGCDIFPLRSFSFYFHRYFMYDFIRHDFR